MSGGMIQFGILDIIRAPTIASRFEVRSIPQFRIFHSHSKVYDGKIDFNHFCQSIEDHFEKRLRTDSTNFNQSDCLAPCDFEKNCLGGRQTCVLLHWPFTSPSTLSLRLSRHKLLWFDGVSELPDDFMKEGGGIWIDNPHRDWFLHVPDLDELPTAIDRVLDGGAKWKKRAAFTNPEF